MKLLFDENLSPNLVVRLAVHQRSFLFGAPPKVIWVRLGNCSTTDVENLLRHHVNDLHFFYTDELASFLSLSRGDASED